MKADLDAMLDELEDKMGGLLNLNEEDEMKAELETRMAELQAIVNGGLNLQIEVNMTA